jgi:hypothetical protein
LIPVHGDGPEPDKETTETGTGWALEGEMKTAEHAQARAIERMVATEYGRDRVARALYEVIHDGLVFGPRDMPTAADREWVRGAMAIPIQETTEVALHVLAWRLTQALERAPHDLMERFDASHRWDELGWE